MLPKSSTESYRFCGSELSNRLVVRKSIWVYRSAICFVSRVIRTREIVFVCHRELALEENFPEISN
jgi:hypothetical protein